MESQPDVTEVTTVGVVYDDSGISRKMSVCHPPTVHVEFTPSGIIFGNSIVSETVDPVVDTSDPEQATGSSESGACGAVETVALTSPSEPCRVTCSEPASSTATKRISVLELTPLPKAPAVARKGRKRTAQASEIITSSPFKTSLMNKEVSVNRKSKKDETSTKKRNVKKSSQIKTKKSATVVDTKRQPSKVASRQKAGRKKDLAASPSSSDAECCLVCGENFDGAWVQCSICEQWAHEDCAELNDPLYYYCDNCRP